MSKIKLVRHLGCEQLICNLSARRSRGTHRVWFVGAELLWQLEGLTQAAWYSRGPERLSVEILGAARRLLVAAQSCCLLPC